MQWNDTSISTNGYSSLSEPDTQLDGWFPDTRNATYESYHSFDQPQVLGEQDSSPRLPPNTSLDSPFHGHDDFGRPFDWKFEDTLAAPNHCPGIGLLPGAGATGHEKYLGVSTGSPQETPDIIHHEYGVPQTSSSERIHSTGLGLPASQSSRTVGCLPYASIRGGSCRSLCSCCGQALQPFDHTSTNPSLEPDLNLNHDYLSNSDLFLHSDRSPIPDVPSGTLDDNQFVSAACEPSSLVGPSLSPSSRSEVFTTPYTPTSSASSSGGCLASSSTSLPDKAPVTYLAVSRAPASTCAECPQVFASANSLERHSRNHRRFACTQGCTKTFTSRKDCRRHESTIHAGENIQCGICGRKGRKDNMRRHMKRHEGVSRDVS